MKRKRKVFYPTSRSSKAPAPAGGPAGYVPTTVVSINLDAGVGRKDVVVGSRVTILGTGPYAGETAVVERLITSGIPAAVVRTEAGATRRVRTIDLQPVPPARPEPSAAARPAATAAPHPADDLEATG